MSDCRVTNLGYCYPCGCNKITYTQEAKNGWTEIHTHCTNCKKSTIYEYKEKPPPIPEEEEPKKKPLEGVMYVINEELRRLHDDRYKELKFNASSSPCIDNAIEAINNLLIELAKSS